jgi:hypothetical protein
MAAIHGARMIHHEDTKGTKRRFLDRGRLARTPRKNAGGTPAVQDDLFSFVFFVPSW